MKQIEADKITLRMIKDTQAFASRIGFPHVSKVHAVTSYVNPKINKKYTQKEAEEIVSALGVDVEADEAEIQAEYNRDQEYLRLNPPVLCLCGHSVSDGSHNCHYTGACSWKDCECGFIITSEDIEQAAYYKWQAAGGQLTSYGEHLKFWNEAIEELREKSRIEYHIKKKVWKR